MLQSLLQKNKYIIDTFKTIENLLKDQRKLLQEKNVNA